METLNEQSKPITPSFRELSEKEASVTNAEFMRTFKDYVQSGLSIAASVVEALIDKLDLSAEELGEIEVAAQKGAEDQERRGFPEDKREYLYVLQKVREKLFKKQQK